MVCDFASAACASDKFRLNSENSLTPLGFWYGSAQQSMLGNVGSDTKDLPQWSLTKSSADRRSCWKVIEHWLICVSTKEALLSPR